VLRRPHPPPQTFVEWATTEAVEEGADAEFRVPGAALALALVFKYGGRDVLLPLADRVLAAAVHLASSPRAARSVLVRKLVVRVAARVGLAYLPPRVAAWRYQRGSRSLLQNLQAPSGAAAVTSAGGGVGDNANDAGVAAAAAAAEMDRELTEPLLDHVESVVEQLLLGLRDKDTVVRWAAAKGVGRVTMRLPKSLADDVVHAVLQLFNPVEGDGAWHGGCLAVAELARRGLLLPKRLFQVCITVVVKHGTHVPLFENT